MCRNIKTLFNFDPPATQDEIHSASLQFVRKITGFNSPSKANEVVYNKAIKEIEKISEGLLLSLTTNSEPRNREVELQKAKQKAARRFGVN